MSSTLYVDKIVEKTSAAGVHIPGHVIQVVNLLVADTTQSTSATWVDTLTTLAITPSSTSSKILVQVNMCGLEKNGNNTYMSFRLDRNGTPIYRIEGQAGYTANSDLNSVGSSSTSWLDSPSSTSPRGHL